MSTPHLREQVLPICKGRMFCQREQQKQRLGLCLACIQRIAQMTVWLEGREGEGAGRKWQEIIAERKLWADQFPLFPMRQFTFFWWHWRPFPPTLLSQFSPPRSQHSGSTEFFGCSSTVFVLSTRLCLFKPVSLSGMPSSSAW